MGLLKSEFYLKTSHMSERLFLEAGKMNYSVLWDQLEMTLKCEFVHVMNSHFLSFVHLRNAPQIFVSIWFLFIFGYAIIF